MSRIHAHADVARRGAGLTNAAVAAVLVGSVAFFVLRGSRSSPAPVPLSLEQQYAQDERIALLTGGCSFGATFEVDTSDPVEVLAGKLDAGGQLEPKKRAMRELAALGAPAREPLARLFQDAAKDRMRVRVAHSVLSVCAISDDPFGVEIALEALESTREDLRAEACLVLRKHPSPEHFDAVKAILRSFSLPSTGDHALGALFACDPGRFAGELEGWLEDRAPDGGYLVSSPVDTASTLVAGSAAPEVLPHVRDILANVDGLLPRHRIFLLAPLARSGDEQARQELRDNLAHELPKPRLFAAEALAKAGLVDDTYVLAATTADPEERLRVLRLIFDETYEPERDAAAQAEVQQWAREALSDGHAQIAEVALGALLRWGDEEGRATLLTLLAGTVPEREMAARAMRDSFAGREELADQVRANLMAVWDRERHGAQRSQVLESVLVSLGAVPGEATGRFILDRADEISKMPAKPTRGYRWVIGQAWNAGPASRDVLLERLGSETDPFKRLDLISFAWQDFELDSFEVLLGIIEDESRSSEERLYAADRALRMAHNIRLLPVLKRIYRGTSDPVLRPGLQCLLWSWFGPPVL
ncbi:MAG: hypothetical protein VX460_08455 [Planctomycetota bacterium]|nr:hypothetical protein [Planctomycetota bacterium]